VDWLGVGAGLLKKAFFESAALPQRVERGLFNQLALDDDADVSAQFLDDFQNVRREKYRGPARHEAGQEIADDARGDGVDALERFKSAAASASFFFMPCEYSSVSFFSSPSSPRMGSNSSMRLRIVS
jgi:hypothetical protein